MSFLKIIVGICLRFMCLYILQTYFNCVTICTLWKIDLSYRILYVLVYILY